VIAGKYAVVRVLGEGGMGVVFEASHVRLRQRVAMKMLLPAMIQHGVLVERFEREARAAAQLKGRHVARVMDVDATIDGLPYMVMEFLEGRDLQVEIDQRGPLPYPEAVDYVLQACAAMAEAHSAGIVHRDLKPSNLFLSNDGGARVVKVLDFGISKYQTERDVKLTDATDVMGTALYMSPEQVKATHGVDGRTDIWSLGVILYESLAGRAPWVGSPTQVAAAIVLEDPPNIHDFCALPPELTTVLLKSLQRNPSDRFSDVRQLAVALAPFAPPGSIGRAYADSLSDSSVNSGSYPRVHSVAPDSAPTFINLAGPPSESSRSASRQAVSLTPSPRSEAGQPRDRTAGSGWSSHGETKKRNRGLLLGAGIAFITVLGLGGAAMMKFGPKTDAHAESPPPSAKSAPVLDDPPPPPMETAAAKDPAPPPTTTSATTPPPTPSAKPIARPAAAPPPKPVVTTAPPAPPSTPAPTPKASAAPKPSGPPDGKPLFL